MRSTSLCESPTPMRTPSPTDLPAMRKMPEMSFRRPTCEHIEGSSAFAATPSSPRGCIESRRTARQLTWVSVRNIGTRNSTTNWASMTSGRSPIPRPKRNWVHCGVGYEKRLINSRPGCDQLLSCEISTTCPTSQSPRSSASPKVQRRFVCTVPDASFVKTSFPWPPTMSRPMQSDLTPSQIAPRRGDPH